MWTSRARPPPSPTCPTPLTVAIARFTCLSAISVSVRRLIASDETTTVMTGSESGSTLVITGGSSCGGTRPIALDTFSRTSLAASLMSRSRTNLTVMFAVPSVMRPDVSSSIPETLLSASSTGSTTELAISSGLAPGRLRDTLTVAGSAFGNKSTPSVRKENTPSTTSDITSIVANTGRRTQSSASIEKSPLSYSPFGATLTRCPSASWSTSVSATGSPAFTPVRISTRSPRRSPTFSSRAASCPPSTTNTRLTP